jgi:pyrimidine operon attenuation protein/uracil phosphoribosyltransferase
MPFGITVASRVFTKLMAAVGGHLRSQQIHIFMYLDDYELPVHKTSDTSCEVETWEFVGMHLADLRWTPHSPTWRA